MAQQGNGNNVPAANAQGPNPALPNQQGNNPAPANAPAPANPLSKDFFVLFRSDGSFWLVLFCSFGLFCSDGPVPFGRFCSFLKGPVLFRSSVRQFLQIKNPILDLPARLRPDGRPVHLRRRQLFPESRECWNCKQVVRHGYQNCTRVCRTCHDLGQPSNHTYDWCPHNPEGFGQ